MGRYLWSTSEKSGGWEYSKKSEEPFVSKKLANSMCELLVKGIKANGENKAEEIKKGIARKTGEFKSVIYSAGDAYYGSDRYYEMGLVEKFTSVGFTYTLEREKLREDPKSFVFEDSEKILANGELLASKTTIVELEKYNFDSSEHVIRYSKEFGAFC